MSTLPALNYLSNAARTEGEEKVAFEDQLAGIKQIPGSGIAETTLTIATGSITPPGGGPGIFSIDTEAAAAQDDLANIVQTNLPDGSLLLIRSANSARVITLKHNAGGGGQLSLRTLGDFTLGDTTHWLMLKRTGTTWVEVFRVPREGVVGVLNKTTTYITTEVDRGKVIDATSGTFTITLLPAARAGIGFDQEFRNSGTGLVTLDGNASETIDEATTLKLYPGDRAQLVCDGTNWKTRSRAQAAAIGTLPIVTKTGTYAVAETDRGWMIDVTSGTFTIMLLAAATAGIGFWFAVRNSGSGLVTLDGNASETIDSALTLAVATGQAITLLCDGSNWKSVASNSSLIAATPVASTSGTTIDFTAIPPGTRRISVVFNGVSTNGTSPLLVQLGDGGGVETSGYAGVVGREVNFTSFSAGFIMEYNVNTAADVRSGVLTLTLGNAAAFTWYGSGGLGNPTANIFNSCAGRKSLSAELDRVRITTVNGTDTFDAGEVNIVYER